MREAIKLLDKNSDGLISFSEFVEWWMNGGAGCCVLTASHCLADCVCAGCRGQR